jgi:predicted small secreted protein
MPRIVPVAADEGGFRLSQLAVLGAALLLAASLAGCNTMRGAGEDISAAGDTLSDTSEEVAD